MIRQACTRADQRRRHRGELPAHLPHVDVTILPEESNCPCCGASMHGEETSQRLDAIPAQFPGDRDGLRTMVSDAGVRARAASASAAAARGLPRSWTSAEAFASALQAAMVSSPMS